MKLTIKRFACLLLVFCLLLTVLPAVTRAEEEPQVDFVLVLDCSGSMAKNDRNGLAADACKKFLDLLPIENARIAVIAYGYNGKSYNFTKFDVKYDANLVQVLSALDGDMTADEMVALKKNIAAATKKESGSNPSSVIGQALAAGVDMLLTSGATDGNACIILLSDGDATSPIGVGETKSLVNSVPGTAKAHGWPIYCIELDYKGKNETAAGKENRQRLTNICVNSGAGADARMKVSDPADVTEALLKIFDRFMDIGEGGMSEIMTLGDDGVASREFEVPELASETNVIISSGAVEYVELITPKGVSRKISTSGTEGDWIANAEKGSYISVKVLRPEAGKWTVKAYGDPKASIHVYNSSMRELGMELIGSPAPGTQVTKNDKISFQSYFTYGGGALNNSGFYTENPARIITTSLDADGNVKDVKEYEMNGDNSGYRFELAVSDIPSGVFTVQVLLKNDMFRAGEQVSNILTYTSENLPLKHDESQNIDRSGYVNQDLEVIDLTKVFPNPDGDPIEYVVECVSDRNVTFDVSIDDNDYMTIYSGLNVGNHQMQISATDPDMGDPLVHTFTVDIENREMDTDKIPKQKLWVDYYNNFFIKQDAGKTMLELDLSQYFSDPDGVKLMFGDIAADVPGLVDASWIDDSGMLRVVPQEKGDLVLHTTVSDGVDTVSTEIEIEVVSGKAVYWATHWIYYVIALTILVVLLLVYLYVKGHTTLKGSWKVTLKKGNDIITTGAGLKMRTLSAVKNAKSKAFSLKELISETMKWMQDQNGLKTSAAAFLAVKDFEAIKLKGIYSGLGFKVLNVPGGDNVEVEYSSQIKTKGSKFRVTTGDLRVTIKRKNEFGADDSLTILLENTGK